MIQNALNKGKRDRDAKMTYTRILANLYQYAIKIRFIMFDGDKQSLKLLNFVFDASTWMQSTDKIVDKHRIKFI